MKVVPKELNRNLLTSKGTGLSYSLASGKENPKKLIKEINNTLEEESLSDEQRSYLEQIKRQLVFREFAYSAIQQQQYRKPPGAKGEDSPEFKALKSGQTGIPIIDAAVRELEETGQPHNRARLLIARYGTRNLNIDPEVISFWLASKFKDYDPALTTFNVVQASSGAPFGEPYFRKSNPLTATKRLDPTGEYRKSWLPPDYKATPEEEAKDKIDKGHQEWLRRWKDNKPVDNWPRRNLYPTRDEIKGNYFIGDSLGAKGNFAHFFKQYKEKEEELLSKAAYIKMKVREGVPPKKVPKIEFKKKRKAL